MLTEYNMCRTMLRPLIITSAIGNPIDVTAEVLQLHDFRLYYPDAIRQVSHRIETISCRLLSAAGPEGLDAAFRHLEGTVRPDYLDYLAGVWLALVGEDDDPIPDD